MNIYAIGPMITDFILVCMGLFVFFKNKASKLNKIFGLFSFSMAVWLFGYTNMYLTKDAVNALKWAKIGFVGIIFIPIFAYHFIVLFLDIRRRIILPVIYLLSVLAIFFSQTDLIYSGIKKHYWGYYPIAGKLYFLFLLMFFVLFARGVILLVLYLKKVEGVKREQVKYVCLAFGIGAFGVVDYLTKYSVFEVYPFGYLCALLFNSLIAYAIIQHRLFDINLVIKRTIIYSSLVVAITIIYILVIFITERFFSHIIGYSSFMITIIAATIIALVFIPLKNKIQYILDHIFFRGTLDSLAKQRELMQEELARSERLKAVAVLAAGMAHEIKNPLTAIKAFAEHLKEKKDDPVFIAKFDRIVVGEVEKISCLVRQLLDFSKPAQLTLQETDINILLDDTLSLLNNSIIQYDINLKRNYAELPVIKVDPNQLKQAFLNLFLNAIEAMANGGDLNVETRSFDNNLGIEVLIQDSGAGISKNDLPRIFDPFYSTKESGTGLGLSITYDIIKKHNGTIKIESQPDKGTLVRVEVRG